VKLPLDHIGLKVNERSLELFFSEKQKGFFLGQRVPDVLFLVCLHTWGQQE
jgi:hypothetical protein